MKIIYDWPPNIEIIKKHFPANENTVFTYGNKLYVPGKSAVPRHLEKHEETHMHQQGENPDAWWGRYFVDPKFRTEQELEAYRRQYKEFCESHKDRNEQARFLYQIAGDLSSPLYGRILSKREAVKLIKES